MFELQRCIEALKTFERDLKVLSLTQHTHFNPQYQELFSWLEKLEGCLKGTSDT